MSVKVFSASALRSAERRFGFRFPADVFEVLQTTPIPNGYDWESDEQGISRAISAPLEGLLFDVEWNGLWWPEWEERPVDQTRRLALVTKAVEEAPKLIPLFGHRYIPEVPNEAGNPIFSVVQSDIIIYGSNLEDWLYQEFQIGAPRDVSVRHIAFWSKAVERNGDDTYNPHRRRDDELQ